MALKKFVQESIPVPTSLSDSQKEELGKRIIDEVRNRTKSGIDKDGKSFPRYSKEYHKSGTPNLTLTGDMLIELDVIKITGSSIVIGYDTNHPDAGQVEGNSSGSYGQPNPDPKKARDFIGLPPKNVRLLIEEIKNDEDFQEQEVVDQVISSILGGIGTTNE